MKNPGPNTFQEAQNSVFKLMESGTFKRFLAFQKQPQFASRRVPTNRSWSWN